MKAPNDPDEAPSHVIPADNKGFTRMAVADVIVETIEGLNLRFLELSEEKRKELEEAWRWLGE